MFLVWFGDSKLGEFTCWGKTGKIGKISKRPRGFNIPRGFNGSVNMFQKAVTFDHNLIH